MTACLDPCKRLSLGALAALCMFFCACNSTGSRQSGTAPNVNGDAMRNVADPNAPFTLRPQPAHLAKREPILDVNGVPVCAETQLSLFETRSRLNGSNHTLRLTLANQGNACRLGGFPAITLIGPNGSILEGINIQKVSADTLSASLSTDPSPAMADQTTSQPSGEVLLPARGSAAFELGWTSGPNCTQVSRLAVSAPGNTESSYVPRQLSLCENRLMVTAVVAEGSE